MRTMDASQMIQSLYEQICDWWTVKEGLVIVSDPVNLGMYFCLEVRCENFGYEKVGNKKHDEWQAFYVKYLHYIILNNRRVYLAISNQMNLSDIDPHDFKNTSNHDSCWRSDGLKDIFSIEVKAWEHCFDHVPKEEQRLPMNSEVESSLVPLLKKPINFVRVKRRSLLDSEDTYFDGLSSIKPVKFKIQIED